MRMKQIILGSVIALLFLGIFVEQASAQVTGTKGSGGGTNGTTGGNKVITSGNTTNVKNGITASASASASVRIGS
jgi:hypothetical protein